MQQERLTPSLAYDPAPDSSFEAGRSIDSSMLASPARSTRTNNSSTSSTERGAWSDGAGDDSALDLLVDAHHRSNNSSGFEQLEEAAHSSPHIVAHSNARDGIASPPELDDTSVILNQSNAFATSSESTLEDQQEQQRHRPSHHDASFGLDPDADLKQSISGRPLFGLSAGHAKHHHSHQHHHDHRSDDRKHVSRSSADSATERSDRGRTPHSSHSGPFTTAHSSTLPDTVPTASATGMPRILPRRYSRSRSPTGSVHSSNAPPPREMRVQSPSGDATGGGEGRDGHRGQATVPSGSLTLAAFAPGLKWTRRLALLSATIGINLGLPFLNGVMLGFGEIFARAVLAPMLGLSLGAVGVGSVSHREELERLRGRGRAQNAAVGLSGVGAQRKDENTRWAQGAEGVDLDGWTLEVDEEAQRKGR